MKWFYNLKTAHKLGLGFGICMGLATIIGVTAIMRMAHMNEITQSIVDEALAGTDNAEVLMNDANSFRVGELQYLLSDDRARKANIERHFDELNANLAKQTASYEKRAIENVDRQNIAKFKQSWKAYYADHDAFMDLAKKGDTKGATILLLKHDMAGPREILDTIDKWNTENADRLEKEAATTYAGARATVVILLALAGFLSILTATVITRLFVRVLKEVGSKLDTLGGVCITNLRMATESLSQGDVTARIDTGTTLIDFEAKDELGKMASSLNRIIGDVQSTVRSFQNAQDSLSKLLAETKTASDGIATSSNEVSAGNADLSQRTEEQAASLEETAASMEEMASTVKQNADNSKLANQLAAQARQVASDGALVVRDAVYAMAAINEGSKRIAEIISVIDDIAFQTNLLALNAAVEAARVGEQGKGFAVVAAEVRSLAGRSATAAKEIKALVQDSVGKVQEGSNLVNQSGERLDEIEAAVKKVADVIAEISAASIEQSVGIDQVNKAVMQMDQVTQQNSALVEEISASSQSMAGVARGLQELVSRFSIDSKYLITVHRHEPRVTRLRATGTDGRAARRTTPAKLTVATSDDGFEEF